MWACGVRTEPLPNRQYHLAGSQSRFKAMGVAAFVIYRESSPRSPVQAAFKVFDQAAAMSALLLPTV